MQHPVEQLDHFSTKATIPTSLVPVPPLVAHPLAYRVQRFCSHPTTLQQHSLWLVLGTAVILVNPAKYPGMPATAQMPPALWHD